MLVVYMVYHLYQALKHFRPEHVSSIWYSVYNRHLRIDNRRQSVI